MVAPEAQDIPDQPDYDIDIPLPEPTKVSIVPDLKEIASEFANYLLQQPNYSAYSSEACKRIYTQFFPHLENFLIVMAIYVALSPNVHIYLLKEENKEEHMFYNLTKHSYDKLQA